MMKLRLAQPTRLVDVGRLADDGREDHVGSKLAQVTHDLVEVGAPRPRRDVALADHLPAMVASHGASATRGEISATTAVSYPWPALDSR